MHTNPQVESDEPMADEGQADAIGTGPISTGQDNPVSNELHTYFEKQAAQIRELDSKSSGVELQKSKVHAETWQKIRKDEASYKAYVEVYLGMALRTVQRRRDVYLFFVSKEGKNVPPEAPPYKYLEKVGLHKLDLIKTLYRASATKLKKYGIQKPVISSESITVTFDGTSYDASDSSLTMRMLKSRMARKASPKGKTVSISKDRLEKLQRERDQFESDLKDEKLRNEELEQQVKSLNEECEQLRLQVEKQPSTSEAAA